jgi:hypothetical protein
MAAIDFPNSPSVNDTHTVGNRIWKWNGTVWEVVRSTVPYATGPTGPTGAASAILAITNNTGTTYTLQAGDVNDLVTLSNTDPITVTVPPSVFSANDVINVSQAGTGQVTFAQGAGVTINSTGTTSSAPKLRARYSTASVVCTASNTFLIVGDIS